MKNREQILMQKIAKREKMKKKFNEKTANTKTSENGRENILTSWISTRFILISFFYR